jgi:hypothetical protein
MDGSFSYLFISLDYSFSSREKWPENELNEWLQPI